MSFSESSYINYGFIMSSSKIYVHIKIITSSYMYPHEIFNQKSHNILLYVSILNNCIHRLIGGYYGFDPVTRLPPLCPQPPQCVEISPLPL